MMFRLVSGRSSAKRYSKMGFLIQRLLWFLYSSHQCTMLALLRCSGMRRLGLMHEPIFTLWVGTWQALSHLVEKRDLHDTDHGKKVLSMLLDWRGLTSYLSRWPTYDKTRVRWHSSIPQGLKISSSFLTPRSKRICVLVAGKWWWTTTTVWLPVRMAKFLSLCLLRWLCRFNMYCICLGET